jgi:hypothetical protein
MTGLLQPANVIWLAEVKRANRAKYQRWIVKRQFKRMSYGNLASPGYALVIQWQAEIWASLAPTLIQESYDYATASNILLPAKRPLRQHPLKNESLPSQK